MENMEKRKRTVDYMYSSAEETHGILGLMERANHFLEKVGLKGFFTSILLIFIVASLATFMLNPGIVFEKFQEYSIEKHEEGIKQRLEADPHIRTLLADFRSSVNADRAYILEAHNGGTNLNNLPFLYADLTYMDPRNKYNIIESEYKNFRLSRYPWASYVIDHGYWFGPIEDCMESDPELYYRLKTEEVSYMGMYVMHGNNGLPTACLGIIFRENDILLEPKDIIKQMQIYSNQINLYLNGSR